MDARGAHVELPEPGTGHAVTHVELRRRPVRRDRARPRSRTTTRSWWPRWAGRRRWRWRTSASRHSCGRRSTSCASRACGVIEVGMAERRGLERNLHDGAQQRLVSLALSLRMAKNKLRDDPDGAEELLDGAAGRAGPGAQGAARAGPRHPPGRAVGPRAARGAGRARGPLAGAGGGGRRPARPPARAGGAGGLLRGVRGAGERGQVLRGQPGDRAAWRARTAACWWR